MTPLADMIPAMTDDDHRQVRAAYYAMVELIDDQVGRMLAALDETGQQERTLVIFMSDHGEMLGDHGIYLKGPHFYEAAVRVPLVLTGQGASPKVCESRGWWSWSTSFPRCWTQPRCRFPRECKAARCGRC